MALAIERLAEAVGLNGNLSDEVLSILKLYKVGDSESREYFVTNLVREIERDNERPYSPAVTKKALTEVLIAVRILKSDLANFQKKITNAGSPGRRAAMFGTSKLYCAFGCRLGAHVKPEHGEQWFRLYLEAVEKQAVKSLAGFRARKGTNIERGAHLAKLTVLNWVDAFRKIPRWTKGTTVFNEVCAAIAYHCDVDIGPGARKEAIQFAGGPRRGRQQSSLGRVTVKV